MSCSKIPVVARVIASDFGVRPILGEFLYVDGVTIVGVPFGGLKGIEIKTMEILHKTQPVSQLIRNRFL